MYRNGCGYPDPTAFKALSNIRREEKKVARNKNDKISGKRKKEVKKHG